MTGEKWLHKQLLYLLHILSRTNKTTLQTGTRKINNLIKVMRLPHVEKSYSRKLSI